MGYIYRRRKKLPDGTKVAVGPYWIKYYKSGRMFQESTHSYKESEARRKLKEREGEIAKGLAINLRTERTLIDELLDDVLLDYRVNGKAVRFATNVINNHLRPYFAGRKAASIGTSDVHRYVQFRRSENQGTRRYRGRRDFVTRVAIHPGSNATINRELALLKHAFHLGWKHTPRKVATVPYIPLLEENNVRKGFFEDDQFLAMRKALPAELRPVITFAYYTGCRREEILSLKWDQVDLAERIVRLEPGTTKNDEPRLLAMTNELFEMLSAQRRMRDEKYAVCRWVFFREGGQPIRHFRRSWKTACLKVGLKRDDGMPNRLFHDLRRSGVRNLVRAGVPEPVAMRISGHKTRSVFDRYNIVSEGDLHEAAKKLDAYTARKRENSKKGYNSGTIHD